jgi:hypothetical protein
MRNLFLFFSGVWMSFVIIFILSSLTSCATPTNKCSLITDVKDRKECNKKETEYYHKSGWRYDNLDRFRRFDQR